MGLVFELELSCSGWVEASLELSLVLLILHMFYADC